MLYRLLIALILIIILMSTGGLDSAGIKSMKSSVVDKEIEATTAVLDKAIIAWYTSHGGEVPDALDKNVLVIMGLENADLSSFTYTKVADNQFTLTAKLSDDSRINSPNSNKPLVEVEPDGN